MHFRLVQFERRREFARSLKFLLVYEFEMTDPPIARNHEPNEPAGTSRP